MRILVLALAGLLSGQSLAGAVTYEPLTLDDGTRVLVIDGEFSLGDDVQKFLAAVIAHNPAIVTFNSEGGLIASALLHGRAIRLLELNTVQLRRLECASACAFAFLGGVIRTAEPGSIGVHQSSFGTDGPADTNTAVGEMQVVTADLLAYLREMDVDPELLQLSLTTSRDDIRYLTGDEMRRMRVTTPEGEPEAEQASPPPPQISTAPPPRMDPAPRAAIKNPELEARSFVEGVIASHMERDSHALQSVATNYAPTVSYFGQVRRKDEVLEDKRAYFMRWPSRSYWLRPSTVAVNCSVSSCNVTGLYDWSVRSEQRNRQASGSATFQFEVDFSGDSMMIIREDSQVLSR